MISKERIVILVLLVRFCSGQDAGSFQWCDPSLNCGPMKNSMCILTKNENTNDCFFIENVMTAEDKRLLLAMHNTVRDKLAGGEINGWPEASDMRQMSWDDTLAAQATLWAFQCNLTSDPCPRHPYYPRPGQTAIEVGDTDDFPNVTAIFKKMVNMGKERFGTDSSGLVDSWSNKSLDGATPGYRNFYQIMYARQTAVGCGLVRYLKTKKGKGGKNVALFTLSLWCNYGVGLDDGQKVYTRGDACAACPDKTKCKSESIYPNLCATSDDPIYGSYIELFVGKSNCHNPATFLTFFSMLAMAMVRKAVMKH